MRRPAPRWLTLLLAMLLSLQQGMAVAGCLRWRALEARLAGALCLAGTEHDAPAGDTMPASHGCPLCQALPATLLPPPAVLPQPLGWTRLHLPMTPDAWPHPPAHAPPYAPTGPPALS